MNTPKDAEELMDYLGCIQENRCPRCRAQIEHRLYVPTHGALAIIRSAREFAYPCRHYIWTVPDAVKIMGVQAVLRMPAAVQTKP